MSGTIEMKLICLPEAIHNPTDYIGHTMDMLEEFGFQQSEYNVMRATLITSSIVAYNPTILGTQEGLDTFYSAMLHYGAERITNEHQN